MAATANASSFSLTNDHPSLKAMPMNTLNVIKIEREIVISEWVEGW